MKTRSFVITLPLPKVAKSSTISPTSVDYPIKLPGLNERCCVVFVSQILQWRPLQETARSWHPLNPQFRTFWTKNHFDGFLLGGREELERLHAGKTISYPHIKHITE